MRRGLRPRSPCSGNCPAAAGVEISLNDFRTLLASVAVLDALACAAPATSKRARRRQVLDAIRQAADDLGNTPAICAKLSGARLARSKAGFQLGQMQSGAVQSR